MHGIIGTIAHGRKKLGLDDRARFEKMKVPYLRRGLKVTELVSHSNYLISTIESQSSSE